MSKSTEQAREVKKVVVITEVKLVTIDGKGRVVIPKKLRKIVGITEKTPLLAVATHKDIRLSPVEVRESEGLKALRAPTFNPWGEGRSVRELIIGLLAERQVMTLRQLKTAARNMGYSMSL